MAAHQSYMADRKVIDSARSTLMIALGRLFHSHRVASELSQEALAAQTGNIGQGAVSAVENGEPRQRQHITMLGAFLEVEEEFVKMYETLV